MKEIKKAEVKAILRASVKAFKVEDGKCANFPMRFDNWGSRNNGRWYWTNTRIKLYVPTEEEYTIKDCQVSDLDMIKMLQDIVKELGITAEVKHKVDECYYSTEYHFKGLTIYGKPCREFEKLQKWLFNHATNGIIDHTTIWCEHVCGKRESWSGSHRGYLAYQPKMCGTILDTIKANFAPNNTISLAIREELDKGEDYDAARHYEIEWYGSNATYLIVEIKTPKGKRKYYNKFTCADNY